MKWMNLTTAILNFGVHLYVGSEFSKHLLATDAKNAENRTRSEFFMTDASFGGSV